jgi:hypothetical protein
MWIKHRENFWDGGIAKENVLNYFEEITDGVYPATDVLSLIGKAELFQKDKFDGKTYILK